MNVTLRIYSIVQVVLGMLKVKIIPGMYYTVISLRGMNGIVNGNLGFNGFVNSNQGIFSIVNVILGCTV
jgi:hypothetical protein